MRGQAITFDFVISLSFFVVGIVLVWGAFSLVNERLEIGRDASDMGRAAYFASETLVGSSGSPPNWHTQGFGMGIQIGLAAAPGELHGAKVRNLSQLMESNYSQLKTLLGIGKYDFYINVSPVGGGESYYMGQEFDESYGTVEHRQERLALLRGNLTKVIVGVWK